MDDHGRRRPAELAAVAAVAVAVPRRPSSLRLARSLDRLPRAGDAEPSRPSGSPCAEPTQSYRRRRGPALREESDIRGGGGGSEAAPGTPSPPLMLLPRRGGGVGAERGGTGRAGPDRIRTRRRGSTWPGPHQRGCWTRRLRVHNIS